MAIYLEDLEELPKIKWVKTEILCGKCERHLHQQEINKEKTDIYYCTSCKVQKVIVYSN